MQISINTDDWTKADATGLAALIEAHFPGLHRGGQTISSLNIEVTERIRAAAENGYEGSTAMNGTVTGEVAPPPITMEMDGVIYNSLTGEVIEPAAAFGAEAAPLPPGVEAASPAQAFVPQPEGGAPSVAPPAPGAAPAVALDKEGLPWDARIHAGSKTFKADGTWKARKNLDDATKASVTAELRAVMAAPAPQAPAAPPPPSPAAAPNAAPPPPVSAESAAVALTASPVPPASSPPVLARSLTPEQQAAANAAQAAALANPAGAAPLPPAVQFANIIRKVNSLQSAGKLTVMDVTSACEGVGLTQPRDLLARPDLIPTFESTIDALAQ